MVCALLVIVRAFFLSRCALAAENLALRQQVIVLQRNAPRAKLRWQDRAFRLLLAWLWSGWRSALIIFSPATVVRWHRQGFRWYWAWKSRRRVGRPPKNTEVRQLIRRLSRENPRWGSPRIQAELRLLGHDVAKSTVEKYMSHRCKPPSPSWHTFLRNHVPCLASSDFFTVPTVTFRVLYVFVVLRHERRQVVHFSVTPNPTAAWVQQQIREAFPFDTAPRYLIRDNDAIYGGDFKRFLVNLGIKEVRTAFRSPWQNPFVERLIGTLRRELLDQVMVLSEAHLRRLLRAYLDYYHNHRVHAGLGGNAPNPRTREPPGTGRVVSVTMVGGLHRRYRRVAG